MDERNSETVEYYHHASAIVSTDWVNIGSQIDCRTAPLLMFTHGKDGVRYIGNGSGVLLRLNQRYFVLTAGHCVRDLTSSKVATLATGQTDPTYREGLVPLEIAGRGFRYNKDSAQDFGYLELSSTCGSAIEARRRVFISHGRITIVGSNNLSRMQDFAAVAGFPEKLQRDGVPPRRELVFYYFAAHLQNPYSSPPNPFPADNQGIQVLDVWTPTKAIGKDGAPPPIDQIPELRGASGGGCWLLGIKQTTNQWMPGGLQLIGTHVASSVPFEFQGESHVFYREVLIGHHLYLIAESDPTMRDYILKKWPNVVDFPI